MDIILDTLKKRYFALASQERYPNTPKITQELDALEAAIRNHITEVAA